MEKLYKKIRGKLHYHEGWEETRGFTEHWGVVGERGESREVKAPKGVRPEAALEKALDVPRKAGYVPIELEAHDSLVIEYKTGKNAKRDLAKRHAVEDWLNDKLGWTGLGYCDGGSVGSGTMEAFCFVVDYAIAKRVVLREIAGTEFADFARLYKIAKDVPAFKPKSTRVRKAGFTPGDCLVVRVKGGRYTAAYIAATHEGPDEKPSNVVVELDYLERKKPDLEAFRKMKPLALKHHAWKGQLAIDYCPARTKALDASIEVAGNVALELPGIDIGRHHDHWVNWKAKPDAALMKIIGKGGDKGAGKYISTSGGWSLGEHIVLQRAWDAGDRSDL
ncbi:hypothetical protein BWI17_07815 [Betaproteobacteria bacterium GR16-43]|nr:hypothetical protein BWI17_07815 [Betaproteobacteria bacterium GR16-43]